MSRFSVVRDISHGKKDCTRRISNTEGQVAWDKSLYVRLQIRKWDKIAYCPQLFGVKKIEVWRNKIQVARIAERGDGKRFRDCAVRQSGISRPDHLIPNAQDNIGRQPQSCCHPLQCCIGQAVAAVQITEQIADILVLIVLP